MLPLGYQDHSLTMTLGTHVMLLLVLDQGGLIRSACLDHSCQERTRKPYKNHWTGPGFEQNLWQMHNLNLISEDIKSKH